MTSVHESDMLKAIMKMVRISIIFFIFGLFFFYFAENSIAASASISLSPSSGSFSKSFPISVVIDGGGQAFNAAQATVTLSPNLTITDLTLGDCNFSYLSTPSITDLSFEGVILGGFSKKCTVYTLAVSPINKGDGTITLSKASVRRYGDAVNILSSIQSGNYALREVLGAVTALTSIIQPKYGLYTVVFKVTNDNMQVTNATVVMKSTAVKNPLRSKTDKNGIVQFPNIQAGIYDATVQGYKGETVLNVRGNNHIIVLGIKVASHPLFAAAMNLLWLVGILILGIGLGAATVYLVLYFRRK